MLVLSVPRAPGGRRRFRSPALRVQPVSPYRETGDVLFRERRFEGSTLYERGSDGCLRYCSLPRTGTPSNRTLCRRARPTFPQSRRTLDGMQEGCLARQPTQFTRSSSTRRRRPSGSDHAVTCWGRAADVRNAGSPRVGKVLERGGTGSRPRPRDLADPHLPYLQPFRQEMFSGTGPPEDVEAGSSKRVQEGPVRTRRRGSASPAQP
jgi:hypothetical protein